MSEQQNTIINNIFDIIVDKHNGFNNKFHRIYFNTNHNLRKLVAN